MTQFKCHTCGSHWTEGPTRDYAKAACRGCLLKNLVEEQERFEALAGMFRFQPGFGWEMDRYIHHDGDEFEAHDLRRWLNDQISSRGFSGSDT